MQSDAWYVFATNHMRAMDRDSRAAGRRGRRSVLPEGRPDAAGVHRLSRPGAQSPDGRGGRPGDGAPRALRRRVARSRPMPPVLAPHRRRGVADASSRPEAAPGLVPLGVTAPGTPPSRTSPGDRSRCGRRTATPARGGRRTRGARDRSRSTCSRARPTRGCPPSGRSATAAC